MSKLWIRCMSLMAAMSLVGLAVTPGFATTMAPQNLAALARSGGSIGIRAGSAALVRLVMRPCFSPQRLPPRAVAPR